MGNGRFFWLNLNEGYMPGSTERKDKLISEKKIYSEITLFTKSNPAFSIKLLICTITRKPGNLEKGN